MEILQKPANGEWHCAVCKQCDNNLVTVIPLRHAGDENKVSKGLIVHVDCLNLSASERPDYVESEAKYMILQFVK